MGPLQIVLVEDNEDTAKYVTQLFSADARFRINSVFTSAESAAETSISADSLWLVDLQLPGMSGIDLVRKLRAKGARMRICCLTAIEDADTIMEAIIQGVDGYILKDTDPQSLKADLIAIQGGSTVLTPRVAQKIFEKLLPKPRESSPLTRMETIVLQRMALAYTYTQIADEVRIAPGTVRKHIENIYQKLRVHSKAEAIQKSREGGWLER